jgi:hypothetical protein
MLQRLILMTALMLLLDGHIEDSSFAQTASEDSYSTAMKVWEKSENLSVSPQAKDLLVSEFGEFSERLKEFGGNVRWKDGTRTLNQTLVIYYLSDLRDRKVAEEQGGNAIPAPKSQGSDARNDRGVTTEWKFSTIGVLDVEAYPVKEFIAKVEPVLKGKKGELHTVSQPSGASIILDKIKKPGLTEKTTVEEAGEHDIRVVGRGVRCSDKVNVPDGGTVTFHCP